MPFSKLGRGMLRGPLGVAMVRTTPMTGVIGLRRQLRGEPVSTMGSGGNRSKTDPE
jgi:hypothetical protein